MVRRGECPGGPCRCRFQGGWAVGWGFWALVPLDGGCEKIRGWCCCQTTGVRLLRDDGVRPLRGGVPHMTRILWLVWDAGIYEGFADGFAFAGRRRCLAIRLRHRRGWGRRGRRCVRRRWL